MTMQKVLFGLGLLTAGLLALAGTGEGAPSAVPSAAPAALVGDARVGKETFTEYCSICHATGGKGFIGPHIGGIDWTTPGLHAIVRGGLGGYGGMPAFNAGAVTDQNIADIAAYLASLAPTPPPQLPTTAPAAVVAVIAPASSAPALATAPSPSIAPVTAPAGGDAVHGHQIFSTYCAACHGASGQGGFGPSLHGEKSRKDTAAAIAWIKNPNPPMPKLYPSPLGAKDVEDVAAYIESL
jgi:mono/diheme cytochrome c family protein